MAIERIGDMALYERNFGLASARGLTGGDPSGLLARLLSGEINLNNVNRHAAENALAYVLNMQQPPGQGNPAGILSALTRQRDDQLRQLLGENEARLSRYGYNPDALRSRLGTNLPVQPRLPITVLDSQGAGPSQITWGDNQADNFRSQMSSLDDVLLQESDPFLQQLNNEKARLFARNNPPAAAIVAAAGSAPQYGSVVPSALGLPQGAADDFTIAASLGPEAVRDATQSLLGQSADPRVQSLRSIRPDDFRTLMDTLRRDPSPESQQLYRTLQALQYRTGPNGLLTPTAVGGAQMSTFPNVGLTSPMVGSPTDTPQLVQQARQVAGLDAAGRENRTRLFNSYGQGYLPAIHGPSQPEQVERVLAAMESGLPQQPPTLSDQQRFPTSMRGPGNREVMSTDQLGDMLMSSDPGTRARAEALMAQRAEAGNRRFESSQPVPDGMTRLYRVQPRAEARRRLDPGSWQYQAMESSGTIAAQGRWFTDNPEHASFYVNDIGRKNAEIVAVDVPTADLDKYRVSNFRGGEGVVDPRRFSARGMSEQEFFLPRNVADAARPSSDIQEIVRESTRTNVSPTVAGAVGRIGSQPSEIQRRMTQQAQATMDRMSGSAVSAPVRGVEVPNPNSIDFRNPASVEQWVDLKLKELIGPGLDAIPAERRNTAEYKQLAQLLSDPNANLIENGRLNPTHVRLMEQVLPEHLNRPIVQKNFVSLLDNLELMQGDTSGLEGRTIPNSKMEWQERRQFERLTDNPRSEQRARMTAKPEMRDRRGRVFADMGIFPMGDAPTTMDSYNSALRLRRRGLTAGNKGAFAGRESTFVNDPNDAGFGFGTETTKYESRMSPEDARLLQTDGATPVTSPQGKLNRLKVGANLLLFGNPEAAGYSRWSPEAIEKVLAGRDIGPKAFSPDVSETIERAYTYDQLIEQGMSDEDINRLPQRTDRKTGITKFIKAETSNQAGQQIGSPTRNLASSSVDSMLGLESSNYTAKRLAPGKGGVRHRRANEKYERRLAEIEDVNKTITRLGQTSQGRQTLKRLEAAIQSGDADTVRAIVSQAGGLGVQAPSRRVIRQGSVEVNVRRRAGQPPEKRRISMVSDGTKTTTPRAFIESKAMREAGGDPGALGAARNQARKDFRFRGSPRATSTGEAVANATRAAAGERRSAESRGDRVRPDRRRTTERERGRPDDDITRLGQRVRDQMEIRDSESLKKVTAQARARGKKQASAANVPEAEVYVFKRQELDGMDADIRRRLEGAMRKRKAEVLVRESDGKLTQMFKSGDVKGVAGGDFTSRFKPDSPEGFRERDLKAYLDKRFKGAQRSGRGVGPRNAQQVASEVHRMGLNPERAAKYVEAEYAHLSQDERVRVARAIREMAKRMRKAPSSPGGMMKTLGRAVAKVATRGKA